MNSLTLRLTLLIWGLGITLSSLAQEYYPEYAGDHRTAYETFQMGQSRAVGAFKSNSYAGNGLAIAFYRGSNPIIKAYKYLGNTNLKMAYEYGTSLSVQRIDIYQLAALYEITAVDTTRYSQFAGGGALRLIYPFGKQGVIEFKAGLNIASFFTPNDYSFYYHTSNGRAKIVTTFETRAQIKLSKQFGITVRYWNIGLNVEYNWMPYKTNTTIKAVQSDVSSTFEFNGVVQSFKLMLAYYLHR